MILNNLALLERARGNQNEAYQLAAARWRSYAIRSRPDINGAKHSRRISGQSAAISKAISQTPIRAGP